MDGAWISSKNFAELLLTRSELFKAVEVLQALTGGFSPRCRLQLRRCHSHWFWKWSPAYVAVLSPVAGFSSGSMNRLLASFLSAEHVPPGAEASALSGLYVRGRRGPVYTLCCLAACHVEAGGQVLLELEVSVQLLFRHRLTARLLYEPWQALTGFGSLGLRCAARCCIDTVGASPAQDGVVVDGQRISDTNPFLESAGVPCRDAGQFELARLRKERLEAGRAPELCRDASSAAAWRKKVLLGWAPTLGKLLQNPGVGKLLADLNSPLGLRQQAESMEPAIQLPPLLGEFPGKGRGRASRAFCRVRPGACGSVQFSVPLHPRTAIRRAAWARMGNGAAPWLLPAGPAPGKRRAGARLAPGSAISSHQ
jgi:hypothetical protein